MRFAHALATPAAIPSPYPWPKSLFERPGLRAKGTATLGRATCARFTRCAARLCRLRHLVDRGPCKLNARCAGAYNLAVLRAVRAQPVQTRWHCADTCKHSASDTSHCCCARLRVLHLVLVASTLAREVLGLRVVALARTGRRSSDSVTKRWQRCSSTAHHACGVPWRRLGAWTRMRAAATGTRLRLPRHGGPVPYADAP